MTDALIARAEQHDYQKLFIQDLNWSRPDHAPITYSEGGSTLTAHNVSSYKGLRVWVVDELPGSGLEAGLDRLIAKTSTDRLVIFYGDSEQVWRWPVRSRTTATTPRLSRHIHRTGSIDPGFEAKLTTIRLPTDATLDVNAVLAKVRSAFDIEAQNETKQASKLMARLYAAMEKAYPADADPKVRDHQISVTLARALFLMFGDDTDMWRPDLFRDFIHEHTAADGSNIGEQLTGLYEYLDTDPKKRSGTEAQFASFPYVNGGIFRERLTLPPLSADFRSVILEACDRNWSTISPAIFGSMFQSVRDAQTRRELGEHYTSEQNILRTLNPLFLDDLRAEFQHITTLGKQEASRLRKLREKLGAIRFMDPACGCGNFIIVAYRELRDLELAIMERLQEITPSDPLILANVGLAITLNHFYGIEIDEWPARIAETAMFLIDRQCDLKLNERLGWTPNRLPIHEQDTILVGNALRLDWADVCPPSADTIVAGNPPFLGHASRSDAQAQDLRTVWATEDISRLDYVTGWYAKALDYFADENGKFAFVSTNSIAQGDPVPHLFAPIFHSGWQIKFAHRTFPWTSEAVGAAAVHCVIVGFARALSSKPHLFDHLAGVETERTVPSINAYLVDGPRVFITKRSLPLVAGLPEATFGNMPRDDGNLIVELDDYAAVRKDAVAHKYLRSYVGAREILHDEKRWCLWLTDLDPKDVSRSVLLRDRIEAVRDFRIRSSAASTKQMAATPHLFGQRPALYTEPYLVIPRVSSELREFYPIQRVQPDVIASDATFTAADPSGLLFAIMSSAMFMTWQKTVGGRLKSDLRFSNTIVWNNLPLPELTARSHEAIVQAGKEVEAARGQYPELSLAQLYRPADMPHELVEAHRKLDLLVDKAFGSGTASPTLATRQHLLFDRYEQLAEALPAG